MNKRFLACALRLLFYVCLDGVIGAVIYAISVGETGLMPGQLAIRILTAMALVSAIVGGPDIMLYWQESGRRIKAEEERDAVSKERDAAAQRADAAEQERDSLHEEVQELRAAVEQLQNGRGVRRSRRRRRLRDNGQ